jgi:GNAT superfamily N-acetyltransferase
MLPPVGGVSGRLPLAYRPATPDDIDGCARLWRVAIEDYLVPLGQPPFPDELGPLKRLLAHTMATDGERFWVAIDQAGELAGFSSATVREGLWFLAMLFVRPDLQGRGAGEALMDRAQAGCDAPAGGPAVPSPDDPFDSGIHTWGMAADAAQPRSNGLYARRGMPPRVPVWRLIGEVRRWTALPSLPATLEAVPFERLTAGEPEGERRLEELVAAVDRELVGTAHPADHAYLVRDGRQGFLVRERAGGRVHGYVYGSGGGRLGPLAALDPDLQPALCGVAIRDTPTFGAVAMWVPGTADRALRTLLEAGLRMEGFPGLVCWSRPDHPFERYVPASLALV